MFDTICVHRIDNVFVAMPDVIPTKQTTAHDPNPMFQMIEAFQ